MELHGNAPAMFLLPEQELAIFHIFHFYLECPIFYILPLLLNGHIFKNVSIKDPEHFYSIVQLNLIFYIYPHID